MDKFLIVMGAATCFVGGILLIWAFLIGCCETYDLLRRNKRRREELREVQKENVHLKMEVANLELQLKSLTPYRGEVA